jgi:hypothetical protein
MVKRRRKNKDIEEHTFLAIRVESYEVSASASVNIGLRTLQPKIVLGVNAWNTNVQVPNRTFTSCNLSGFSGYLHSQNRQLTKPILNGSNFP